MLPEHIISKFKSRIGLLYPPHSRLQYLHSRRRYYNSIPLLSIVALLGNLEYDNHIQPNSNPTHSVWWCSSHCRSDERRNRTRGRDHVALCLRHSRKIVNSLSARYPRQFSQTFMTSWSRISSWSVAGFAFLIVGLVGLACNNSCYATEQTIGDSTASMILDTSDVLVNVTAGATGYASKSITINTNNTESYTLTITAPAVLKNEEANTTNTWSYAYGQDGNVESMSYTTFDGGTKQLEAGIESDGRVKTLVFSSHFDEGLSTGHYKAEVTLGLTATPKAISGAEWLWSTDGSFVGVNSGITTMQEMTPEVCAQVATSTAIQAANQTKAPTLKLVDSRDNSEYTIAKYPDGKCWMTENLRLKLSTSTPLTSTDSNISVSSWIPAYSTIEATDSSTTNLSSTDFSSSFDYKNQPQSYLPYGSNTVYYNWHAATAGTGNASITTAGANASSSICPKGWKLPSGGIVSSTTDASNQTDFFKLFKNMNLGVSSSLSATGSTTWNNDASKNRLVAQGTPYNFAYTGGMYDGSTGNTGIGYWWSRTAYSSTGAYTLDIRGTSVYPGTTSGSRCVGYAMRCVAEY